MKNQKELIKEVAQRTGFTQKDIKIVMDAVKDVTYATLKEDEVKLFEGVTLGAKYVDARIARNPATGEAVEVPAKYKPVCKFGQPAKDAVND